MQSVSSDLIKIKAYYSCCLFPKAPIILGTEGNSFGITKFEIAETLEGVPVINKKDDTVTITGDFFEPLKIGAIYTILAKKKEHPIYGIQYSLIYINEQIDLNKLSNQRAFLSSFLTEGQINELYKVYDNPLPIIEAHDIEGLKKVHGVGDYIAQCIIDRFEDNKDLSSVYSELNNYGLTPNFIRKLISTYSSPSTLIKVVKEHPYQLVYDINGVGFKTADDIALKGGMSPKDYERVMAYIHYFLDSEATEHGNSYVTAGELLTNIFAFFGGKDEIVEEFYDEEGNITGTNISKAINELQGKGIIIVEDNESKSRRRVYLTYYYNLENEIAYHLKRLLAGQNTFDYTNWENDIKELEEKQGFPFAKEQLDGIKLGLAKQVCLISGLAGSGKSSLVSGILAGLSKYSFAQCALSGKAAARLQEVTGAEGSTIHRLLGYSEGGFMYNEDNQLPYDIIILDEVSLVGGEIFLDLIKAIPSGSKLIMLGDLGQLEAIGALNLASDIYNSPIIPTVELKEIHRQAAKSGIITSAHEVRNQKRLFNSDYEGTQIFGELKDMLFDISKDKEDIRKKAIDWFNKGYNSSLVNRNIMKIQVISPVRERGDACVFNLNNDIQKIVNPVKPGMEELICGPEEKCYKIHIGDKVMCIKNNYSTIDESEEESPIYNGWIGIVEDITSEFVFVDFPLANGITKIKRLDAMKQLVLGYVSTVHKLQGSDAPIVIGVLDYSTPPSMLTCQLLYTLITRAKKYCIVVGQCGAINKAISNDFVSQKRTFLQELLLKG